MDVNNAGVKIREKLSLQMFHDKQSAFNTFVRPQGYTQCVCTVKKLHRALLEIDDIFHISCVLSFFLNSH